MIKKDDLKITTGNGFPLGVTKTDKGVQFSLALAGQES